ncbi:acyl-CoA dehydrogenase family protein [Parenemella sanctibonifatiensis]|uniref:Medium-chain specific acyl-CoA dehydrogenase, mitochondrial n=1 Tax=Parenemella sanctibonifatiensis TaxID=2016505 RepID=A0A255EFS7_9ACTN|nr:acyl-CoA dehydrogenase [Parenemella sanctibonifatiensis]OYN88445.1 acyl-CoA dehydrogenase [Parenemella sanctibonifatiensis]
MEAYAPELTSAGLRAFIAEHITPHATDIDREARFPAEQVAAAGRAGVPAVLMNGTELDLSRAPRIVEVSESLAAASMACGIAITNCRLMPYLLSRYAEAEVRDRWVGSTLRGETYGAFAITEPHAGTDVRALSTVARRDGEDYVVTGEKLWVGYAPNGSYAITLAKLDSDERDATMVALVIDLASEGVTRGHGEELSGVRGMANGWIKYDNVRVPGVNRLNVEGFSGMMDGLNLARIDAAAFAVGLIRGAAEEAISRAATRPAFGGTIGDLPSIQAKIGQMLADYRAARELTRLAAESFAQGGGGDQDLISMAKLFAADASRRHTDEAVQVFGAQGIGIWSRVNRLNRDSKITQIFDGTSEIHETMLGRRAVRGHLRGELPPALVIEELLG